MGGVRDVLAVVVHVFEASGGYNAPNVDFVAGIVSDHSSRPNDSESCSAEINSEKNVNLPRMSSQMVCRPHETQDSPLVRAMGCCFACC